MQKGKRREALPTSYSLMAETLKELGDIDLVDGVKELLNDEILCLGRVLLSCKACR